MISCPHCATPNRKGSNYCCNCGQRLGADASIVCPSCRELNPPRSAYCSTCGGALLNSANAQEGEGEQLEDTGRGPDDATPPRRELPAWLRPLPGIHQQESSPSSCAPVPPSEEIPAEQGSKYLQDIRGTLQRADGWLLSLQERAGEGTTSPDTSDLANTKPGPRPGA